MATDVRDLGLDGMRATVVLNPRLAVAAGSATSAANTAAAAATMVEELGASTRTELAIPLLGRANLANVLAGMAVALDAGVPLVDLVERARTLKPASHRGEVMRLASGITVMDEAPGGGNAKVTDLALSQN